MEGSSVLFLFIAGTLLLSLFAFFLVIYLQVQKRKQNRFRIEKEQLQQEILRTGLEVQEQAINNISRELHDNIGARLSAVYRFLNVVEANPAADNTPELIRESGTMLQAAIKDMRDISHVLSSEYVMENGLIESVYKEVDYVRKTTSIDAMVLVEGDYYHLNSGHELIIFRMVQEAISNTLKYAKATHLRIRMSYGFDSFDLCITDDGVGFDAEAVSSGIGIANMKNRARMLKANLDIKTSAEKGTTILLNMKVHEKA
ncbi:hypothetical protein CAP35_12670 [Chitinophagaceae bacterium IBVUCB1]|nr:hypothetical protein CAP35_12670 [Chitinophagaceae bacterium IBVUCB1]